MLNTIKIVYSSFILAASLSVQREKEKLSKLSHLKKYALTSIILDAL